MRIKLFGKTSVGLLVLALAWVVQSTPALAAVSTVAYSTDSNTVLLDHFDGATSASILAYSENGAACGSAKPSATANSAYVAGSSGLGQALSLNPPVGQAAGSATYLQYPGGQLLSVPNGTIEFWTYLTSYGAGVSLVDQGQFYTACNGWTFSMGVNAAGQLNAGAWAAFNMNSGVTTVPLNTWTHVAASWGSTGAKLYINGVQVGSDANTGMPASGYSGSVLIRAGTHTGANGQIDELRISSVQRTSFATAGGVGTGAHSANGTYTWNSATATITVNTTSSDFICDGLTVGTESVTGVAISNGTMTWTKPDGTVEMTWTRSAGGAAGDIVGIWTAGESIGNSYALTVNSDGTFSLAASIVQCGGGSGGQNPSADAQHWSSGYSVQFRYNDPNKTATAVTVIGPGVSGSAVLAYNANYGSWDSWTSNNWVSLGTTYPTGLPFTYTFAITEAGATRTATSAVSCFQAPFATNLTPTGSLTGTPTFSWTGIADASAVYGVELNASNGNRIWQNYNISGTSIAYNGPALTAGTTYNYLVNVRNSSACSNGVSFAQGSFTFGNGGGSDTTAPTVPTGVNAVAATSNQVNVNWYSSTDNVGVTYYKVFRNGVAAGTPQGPNNTYWPDNQVSAGNTYTYTVSACDAAWNCSAQSSPASATTPAGTGVSQFDGTYTGSWSKTCPACGITASAGTFTATLANGIFSNTQFILTSGDSGVRFDAGTVSLSGTITGTGATPSQCSSSVSTFVGQITATLSGGAAMMTITYSRPTSDTCAAESGGISATRTSGVSSTSSTSTSTSTTTTSTTTTTTLGAGTTATLVPGWNLVGNSSSGAIDVATAFGDKTKVTTVWKWIASTSKWAFYAPSLSDGGAAYAAGKGYDFLTSVSGGEGFWVNAGAGFSLSLPVGSAKSSASFQLMGSGWNLIAIGDGKTPSAFNKALSVEPPSPGVIPVNLTTLWAWDAGLLNWYFYAPSLEANGGLAAYITSKSYLNFDTKTLGATTGFWVNKP